MIDPATRARLQWAVDYISLHNEETRQRHLNPRTREIEPASVRKEVAAANAWLEKARRALKPEERAEQTTVPASECPHATEIKVREYGGRVRYEFDVQCAVIELDADRAAQLASATIKHAKIAGRKTGRIIEVKP